MKAPELFRPYARGPLQSANRLLVAPMTRVSATQYGDATDAMVRYYARFARGGFGIVISEGIYTDEAYAQCYRNQPGLATDTQAASWRQVADAVHAAGGRIYAQLMHAGALAQENRFRRSAAAPSAVQPRGAQMAAYHGSGPYRVPLAMSAQDIEEAIAGFAAAAGRALTLAGFDGIEIHGANGYLIDQFLNSHTNVRTDSYGGGVTERYRFATRVVSAVRAAIGPNVPLGLRISQAKVNDPHFKWPEGEQGAAALFGMLAACGIDYLHLPEPDALLPAFTDSQTSLLEVARTAAPELALVANGGLDDPLRAAEALRRGADFVALGRGALANPDWPQRVAHGTPRRPFDDSLLRPIANLKPRECEI
ncbi:NADH:flavin oxidoreductase [Massilia arenosa]|uniref:NADH:flavin oxidoreductase n=1 Tax=Zemynaea arenosa TaxID=2561931 RepID=A0A4Y9SCW7_9BURK|nr:NADH:flavin oxidoreductase [Massilia arenosa]TFW20067.1 NADH:flavin oxidoreductase [Massilia arenosa]